MDTNSKYESPDWLDGKVYDVIKSVPELSIFAECVEKTGLDEIINSSGLYTVMAPCDSAFETYFSNHPLYNSIDDIDSLDLLELVKFHIILMPYSKEQLRTLDFGGWIDDDDEDPQYYCFKRETFYQPDDFVVNVVESNGVVSSINSDGSGERIVYSGYNKYAPIYYWDHLDYVGITSSDYEYYFDREFDKAEVYFGGAMLMSEIDDDGAVTESYSAENGYVFMVDQVVEPMLTGYEHLFNEDPDRPDYSDFGNLIDEFATLTYNEDATYDQSGASDGLYVDMLYDLDYPSLSFNISSEITYSSYSDYTIAIHNGLFAPTNSAYNSFVSQVLTKNGDDYYANMSLVPANIKRLIVNSHMIQWNPYYPSLAGENGTLRNSNDNAVNISDINVEEKVFGSNVTFVGLDEVIMPQALSSVVAPVMLRTSYYSFYWALYASSAIEILQVPSVDYTLFVIPDDIFETDSTLFVYGVSDNYKTDASVSTFRVWDKGNQEYVSLPTSSDDDNFSLRGFVYSHIGIGTIYNNCRKEFLRNLSGQYIVIDNENNTVSGGESSTAGYNGGDQITLTLDEKLEEDYGSYGSAPENGETYSIDGWLQFPSVCFSKSYIEILGGDRFVSLMERVGMVEDDKLTFLDEGEVFTLFLPTDEALDAAQVDTLSDDDLTELLEAHFVLGVNAFTDNINKNPTATKYYTMTGSRLSISSDAADELNILDNTGEVYYTVTESETANKMYLGWDNGVESDESTYSNKILAGVATVVHQIDTVIVPGEVLE
jgi:uncharacterized surface protein with fasciclin (FAS1) repeats